MSGYLLGVDTGGTFTDFALYDGQRLRVHKRLSTPDAPERAILAGIAHLQVPLSELTVIHGSTVATNAALEGKGVKTAYITNRGFADTLTIGRQNRADLYDLQPPPRTPPVPASLCFETGGRQTVDGREIDPLTANDLERLRQQIQASGVEAVAINLLFSFLDDNNEKRIAAVMPKDVFVSRSSAVLPEYKEYERGITTWLNAWVGPVVQRYLTRLQTGLAGRPLAIMQSNGGTMSARHACEFAVHMLLSGPAGGLSAARYLANTSTDVATHGADPLRFITFDMGGTSTDVALYDDHLRLTNEGSIGPYPVGISMIDIHTIGAGGGSLAYVDEGGLLHVGPQSAGAEPGPACYQRGGTQATVTDANVVLGRIPRSAKLGGTVSLDIDSARRAVGLCAQSLGLDIEAAARGIIALANEHMQQALRLISVQRGFDPKTFTLLCFGGAGGLHVCELAQALGMSRAMVPAHGGVLSAFGMLTAPRARTLSRTHACILDDVDAGDIDKLFRELVDSGSASLATEGVDVDTLTINRRVDLRYRGQSYTLTLNWDAPSNLACAFHRTHEHRFGHRLDLPIELVTLRVTLLGPTPDIRFELSPTPSTQHAQTEHVVVTGEERPVPVYVRDNLIPQQTITGPAIFVDDVSTTYLTSGWSASIDQLRNLHLIRG